MNFALDFRPLNGNYSIGIFDNNHSCQSSTMDGALTPKNRHSTLCASFFENLAGKETTSMGAYEVKKARAIALTVEGHTQKAIADALCVDTRTIRRWAKEPDFIASLKEERESALELAKAQ